MGTHSNRAGASRAQTGDGEQPNVGQLPLVHTLEAPPTTAHGSPAPRSRAAGHRAGGGSRRRPAGGRRRRGGTGGRRRTAVALGVLAALTAAGVTWNSLSPGQATPVDASGAAAAQPDTLAAQLPAGAPTAPPGVASPSATTPVPHAPGASPVTTPTAAHTPTASPATSAPAPVLAPPPVHASTSAHPSPTPTATPSGDYAQQVLALVNIQRAQNGCGPVTANAKLQQAAQGQSDDMAARNFFDHTNPDGAGPQQRIDATGYQWSTWGENIAMGQPTPASVMDSWMNSPGHRANILNCAFKELGVGVHLGPGGPWWTQDFGAPA
ncbi:uncharacterized protein YkwD [Kitasatospora sp. MAP12-15]|uniref:CAP domain-containing protein n=1 Tax=unclassified Kitasatospora TaxID=2633591 RepID=UPI00247626AA|nr:CAP domain-containing protein [Kitasatospora sp. MAP12-44]MDH6113953.1 uncharacterized protein YkwD [Kitasatospora sp. MAP12-44]